MGKRGPAKKPSALEKLQGNPGKRAPNKKEPKPERGVPRVPAHLDVIGKHFFKRYAKMLDNVKVITKADKAALELAADAYSEYRRARAVILKKGMTYESHKFDKDGNVVSTMIRPRPEAQIAQSAWNRCCKMLQQFGLTPSSRTGVEMLSEPEKDDLDDFLNEYEGPAVVKK